MNTVYRDLVLVRVQAAVAGAKAVADLRSKGLKGSLREIVIRELLRPFLPADIGVNTGVIITADGQQSPEQDVVIFDRRIVPPILMEERVGLFPVESALITIEIKSKLTAEELKKSHENAEALLRLVPSPGIFDPNGMHAGNPEPVIPTLLAFDTDLSESPDDEIRRYDRLRSGGDPALKVICVVGRGYWSIQGNNRTWEREESTDQFEEILAFLVMVMNSYRVISRGRKGPDIGAYLAAEPTS